MRGSRLKQYANSHILLDDVMFNFLNVYIMNKTVLEIRELILSAIDYFRNYFLKKDPIEIQEIEKPKQEPNLADLWEKCPSTCGCEKGCAIDDAIFYESALLDVYRARLKNDQSKN
jgi:hypothetical protein